jgi:hypothetical protein
MGEPCLIKTGPAGTTRAELDVIVRLLMGQQRVVLHFHGGLVNTQSALEGDRRLQRECYDPVGVQPVFVVWESGLLEVLCRNIRAIAGEDLFKALLKWLSKLRLPNSSRENNPQPTSSVQHPQRSVVSWSGWYIRSHPSIDRT